MYTGLVRGMGEVVEVTETFVKIKPKSYQLFAGLKLEDSVAVDGQTAIVSSLEGSGSSFVFKVRIYGSDAVPLKPKDVVDLETSLLTTSRVEGIYMLGLVDANAEIIKKERSPSRVYVVTVKVSREILKKIAPNGYLLINGVALRVTQVDDANTTFIFDLWPETAEHTSLGRRDVGSFVNIELDILSKYVEKYHYKE